MHLEACGQRSTKPSRAARLSSRRSSSSSGARRQASTISGMACPTKGPKRQPAERLHQQPHVPVLTISLTPQPSRHIPVKSSISHNGKAVATHAE